MTQKMHDRRWPIVVASVLLVGIGLACGLVLSSSLNLQNPLHARETAAESAAPVPQSPFVSVADKVVPAVVFIDVKKKVSGMARGSQFDFSPFGDFFKQFGGPQGQQSDPHRGMTVPSSGSGFIISKDGYVLTNNHVISDASEIKVRLHDGREFKAKVVGTDPTSDVGVLKIEASDLPTVVEGRADDVKVGDWAIAVGNPGGLEGTVTVGIVSAKGRTNLDIQGGTPQYQDFIQTDAAINFGNSGGPLCNIRGEVIGINTAINPSGQGIGFAIPIELAKHRSEQLIATGKVIRGYLGIRPDELSPELIAGMNLPESTKGVIVGQVESNTPAQKAGVHEGDVIVKFNGRSVRDVSNFRFQVADSKPGDRVVLDVLRDAKPMTLTATLTQFPDEQVAARTNGGDEGDGEDSADASASTVTVSWMGVSVSTLTPALVQAKNLSESRGVYVQDVDQDGAAAEAGLRPGDIIKKVDATPVSSVAEFRQAVKAGKASKKAIVLFIKRGTTTTFLGVQVPQD